MILTVNCGNTHTTFGCVGEADRVERVFKLPTGLTETSFGYAAKIRQVLALWGMENTPFEGAVISCVVPPLTEVFAEAMKLLGIERPLVLGAGVKSGLHLCINDPGTVASDLVAAAVGVKEHYPLPCVAVDMGTATTFTVVDGKGRYIGGAICPGVHLSLDALSKGTALLPRIDLQAPRSAIGANTVDCMRAGTVFGAAGAVDGILDRIAEEIGQQAASVVATGEAAGLILPHCRHAMIHDEHLILKGLAAVWRRNLADCSVNTVKMHKK